MIITQLKTKLQKYNYKNMKNTIEGILWIASALGLLLVPVFIICWIWLPEYSWGKMIATDVILIIIMQAVVRSMER